MPDFPAWFFPPDGSEGRVFYSKDEVPAGWGETPAQASDPAEDAVSEEERVDSARKFLEDRNFLVIETKGDEQAVIEAARDILAARGFAVKPAVGRPQRAALVQPTSDPNPTNPATEV